MNQNPPPTGPGERPPGLRPPSPPHQQHVPPPPAPAHHPHPHGGFTPPHGHYPPGMMADSNPWDTQVMTTKDWLITLLLMAIPCVNLIMLFVWAFSHSGNHNRRNYARATLVFALIGFVLGIVVFFVTGAAIVSLLQGW